MANGNAEKTALVIVPPRSGGQNIDPDSLGVDQEGVRVQKIEESGPGFITRVVQALSSTGWLRAVQSLLLQEKVITRQVIIDGKPQTVTGKVNIIEAAIVAVTNANLHGDQTVRHVTVASINRPAGGQTVVDVSVPLQAKAGGRTVRGDGTARLAEALGDIDESVLIAVGAAKRVKIQ